VPPATSQGLRPCALSHKPVACPGDPSVANHKFVGKDEGLSAPHRTGDTSTMAQHRPVINEKSYRFRVDFSN
jgi:hypothetical protein